MSKAKRKLIYFIILFLVFLISFYLFYGRIDTNLLFTSVWIAFIMAILIPPYGREKNQNGQPKN
jgi:cell division protein FtsW (lipid II flippase)